MVHGSSFLRFIFRILEGNPEAAGGLLPEVKGKWCFFFCCGPAGSF